MRRMWYLLYRFYDADRQPLYIGITTGDAFRWTQHRKRADWWPLAESVAVSTYHTHDELLVAEKAALRHEQPRFNKQGVRWPSTTYLRFDGTAADAAAHLFSVAHPDFLLRLSSLLAQPERFPQPSPPPRAWPDDDIAP